eukprot:365892-Chlamydomonas_euryale.AAC.3
MRSAHLTTLVTGPCANYLIQRVRATGSGPMKICLCEARANGHKLNVVHGRYQISLCSTESDLCSTGFTMRGIHDGSGQHWVALSGARVMAAPLSSGLRSHSCSLGSCNLSTTACRVRMRGAARSSAAYHAGSPGAAFTANRMHQTRVHFL